MLNVNSSGHKEPQIVTSWLLMIVSQFQGAQTYYMETEKGKY